MAPTMSMTSEVSTSSEQEKDLSIEVEDLEVKEQDSRKLARKRDDELVKRTLAGDRSAYRELFEIYRPRAQSIAYNILKSKEDAEDVVQESFVKAYLALPKYKGQAAFYTWFFRIIYNMAIDFKRKFTRQGGEKLEFDEKYMNNSELLASEQTTPFKELAIREELQVVSDALQQLTDEHRAVLTLREIDGLSYDEIADVTEVSKGTVMSRLHYARKHLRESIRKYELRDSDSTSNGNG